MKCSRCSALVKPVVAVDIDGTLGQYHDHFLWFAGMYLGRPISRSRDSHGYAGGGEGDFRRWFLKAHAPLPERAWHDLKLAYRQGGMKRSMPIYEGAVELCVAIRKAGAELHLTTTRPYLRLDNIDPDTRWWLDRHGIEYDGLLYDEDKYHVLASNVDPHRVVAVLDDLPEQYDAAVAAFGEQKVLLKYSPYNRAVLRLGRVQGMGAIREIITTRIYQWREQHD